VKFTRNDAIVCLIPIMGLLAFYLLLDRPQPKTLPPPEIVLPAPDVQKPVIAPAIDTPKTIENPQLIKIADVPEKSTVTEVNVLAAFADAKPKAAGAMGDYYDALYKARAQKVKLLLFFYGDGCQPCAYMKKNVFPDGRVKTALGKDILLPLHLPEMAAVKEVPDPMVGNRVPTLVLIDPGEKEGDSRTLAEHVGGMNVNQFVQWYSQRK